MEGQTYPQDLIEVIVVDNGSSDNSPEVAASFGARVLYELEEKSPYAARNLGLQHATGSIIAMTDANKIPDKRWIEEGLRSIISHNADLAGGEILFDLAEKPSSAQIFDAMMYNNNRMFVLERQSSAAGNLFFKREVIEEIGPFPGNFRSGMDIWWTQNAVQKGFKLVFAEKSIVYCSPRNFKAVAKKSWRVGVFHPVIFKQKGKSFLYILGQTFRSFAPPKIEPLKKKILDLDQAASILKIWCIAWASKIMMGFGRIRGLAFTNKEVRKKTA